MSTPDENLTTLKNEWITVALELDEAISAMWKLEGKGNHGFDAMPSAGYWDARKKVETLQEERDKAYKTYDDAARLILLADLADLNE